MIYLVHAPSLGLAKIGWTENDVRGRLSALRVASPVDLELALFFPGDRSREMRLHAAHDCWRVRGEWFWDYVLPTIGLPHPESPRGKEVAAANGGIPCCYMEGWSPSDGWFHEDAGPASA